MPDEFRPGEMVWASIWFRRGGSVEEKIRPAMVLEVTESGVRLAWGTSTEREQPHYVVRAKTNEASRWRLRNDTWFYGNTQTVSPDSIQRIVPPPTGLLALGAAIAAIRELAV